MSSTFLLAPLSAPHNQSNKMALVVLNEEMKSRILSLRQTLLLHDAISTSIEFTGVFIDATTPFTTASDDTIETLIAWFTEHTLPIESGVLTVFADGFSVSGIPIGQNTPSLLSSDVIPYPFLDKAQATVSLLPNQHMFAQTHIRLQ